MQIFCELRSILPSPASNDFVNEHNNTKTKPQAKKQRFLKLSQKFPEEKQQLVEEKDADNMRKVLLFVNHSFSGFEN